MSRRRKLALVLLALGVAAIGGYLAQNGGNGGILGRFGIDEPPQK